MPGSRVTPLVAFGVGMVAFGFFYRFYNEFIDAYIVRYIVPSKYYVASDFIWDLLPWLCVVVGVISLILAGVFYGVSRTVVYE